MSIRQAVRSCFRRGPWSNLAARYELHKMNTKDCPKLLKQENRFERAGRRESLNLAEREGAR